jgi:hypothetical protein
MSDSELVDTKAASTILSISELVLRQMRMASYTGRPGPEWYRLKGRIRYKRSDLAAYLEAQKGRRPDPPKPRRLSPAPPS